MRTGYLIKFAAILIGFSAVGSLLLVYRWHLGAQWALGIMAAVLCAVLGISVFIGGSWLFQVSAKSIVEKWAAEQGNEVLAVESPFATGAFSFWTTSRGQVVYFVTIRDRLGNERKAWVRCGSHTGTVLFSNRIEVRWHDQPRSA
jgi:hypothetical protein